MVVDGMRDGWWSCGTYAMRAQRAGSWLPGGNAGGLGCCQHVEGVVCLGSILGSRAGTGHKQEQPVHASAVSNGGRVCWWW